MKEKGVRMPRFYNTLTRCKEELRVRDPGRVGMYVCGPTVYDYSHIGHARAYVFFDVVVRYLRRLGYDVTYVRNVTDLDDKIINRAAEMGETFKAVAEKYEAAFHEDMQALGNLPPLIEPRATEHIAEMQELIGKLIEKGVGYMVDGDVYFSIAMFPQYGKLSRRSQESQQAGARVKIDPRLKSPADFALWKAAKPGEPSWPSPWGPGRPGWHIECSAMSLKYLGPDFDIHGGGMDLIFPHHENEIAQAEAAQDKPFCRMFLHNGFVNVNKEKMSKSLGNFFLVRQVLQEVDAEALRLFLLGTHYRGPIDLIVEVDPSGEVKAFPQIMDAQRRVLYHYETKRKVEEILAASATAGRRASGGAGEKIGEFEEKILHSLDDDANTALALAHLSDAFRYMNDTLDGLRRATPETRAGIAAIFDAFLSRVSALLGILEKPAEDFIETYRLRKLTKLGISRETIEKKIEERNEARAARNYALADKIRNELMESGIELMDERGKTTWRVL